MVFAMRKAIHRFSVPVNCGPAGGLAKSYRDDGFLILPESYSESGRPTRLVINCHGAGGTVTTDDSQVEHQALTQYLVANGYAVMDVNGLPAEYAAEKGIDLRNNIGGPMAIESYAKGYRYCMGRFNLEPEVFVHGGSMGGISSTNLVLSGLVPVVAQSGFCPVLDAYNEIFLHPWSSGLPKTALGKLYGFEKDDAGEYVYDAGKIRGFDPMDNPKSLDYPVPVKFWHCEDDPVVSCGITRRFVERIVENGGTAYLRTFPNGGHEPQLVGGPVDRPCGVHVCGGRDIAVTQAVEEAFVWIRGARPNGDKSSSRDE